MGSAWSQDTVSRVTGATSTTLAFGGHTSGSDDMVVSGTLPSHSTHPTARLEMKKSATSFEEAKSVTAL